MRFLMALAMAAGLALPATAATIDFNDLASDAFYKDAGNPYTAQGWQFVNSGPDNTLTLFGWGRNGNAIVYNADADPNSGSTLVHNQGQTVTTVSRLDGGAFTLGSLQMADVFNGGGNLTGGGPVLFTFQTVNGASSETRYFDHVRGLQTEIFNLSGLLSFSIAPQQFQPPNAFAVAGLIQIDNVSVTADRQGVGGIPEPSTWAVLITGFGLAGAALRRRRSPLTTFSGV